MALINIRFASEALGMQTNINVVIPQKSTRGEIGIKNNAKDEKYKTLYLFHGLQRPCLYVIKGFLSFFYIIVLQKHLSYLSLFFYSQKGIFVNV